MSDLWPEPVPGAPCTSRSLAHLALGVSARDAADFARSMVPTGPLRTTYDGMLLADALRLQELAERIVQAAVVIEREDGTGWDEIADTLGVSVDAAQDSWQPVEQRWREQVELASTPGYHDHDLPESLIARPADVAHELDQWVTLHREARDPDRRRPSGDRHSGVHAPDAGVAPSAWPAGPPRGDPRRALPNCWRPSSSARPSSTPHSRLMVELRHRSTPPTPSGPARMPLPYVPGCGRTSTALGEVRLTPAGSSAEVGGACTSNRRWCDAYSIACPR